MRILRLGLFLAVAFPSLVLAQSDNSCIAALRSDPALAALADKVALSGEKEREFSLMTVQGFPTESEKQAIQRWLEKREDCWRVYQPPDSHPGKQVFARTFRKGQMLVLRLLRGELTYGKFNEIRSELAAENEKEIQQARSQYEQQRQQQQYQQQQQSQQQQALQYQLLQQQQQRQYEQQQELRQRNFYADQACLARARNQSERLRCQSEAGIRDGVQGLIQGIGGQ
jgi:hypothetical protein